MHTWKIDVMHAHTEIRRYGKLHQRLPIHLFVLEDISLLKTFGLMGGKV
jgi:hypothetical protein